MPLSVPNTFISGQNPVFQALITFAGVIAANVGALFLKWTGLLEVGERFPWMVAASFLLCFSVFNSIYSLTSANMIKYYGASVYSFAGLALVSGLLAWAISSLSISQAGSYRWIFIVVSIGYMVFMGMVSFMRAIVEFAQKEEWNHPRLRRRSKNKR
ncbi:MAG: hypothetical protein ACKOA4_04890 [Haliscomenobacter sp.]